MKAPKTAGFLAIAALAALSLPLPALTQAKGAAGSETSDPSPGITVTGIGFAPIGASASSGVSPASGSEQMKRLLDAADPTAVKRAVRDARHRSREVARMLGLEVDSPTEVELREISQFGQPRACGRRDGPNCREEKITAAAVTMTFAIVGGADDSTASSAVSAHGVASLAVKPSDPKRSRPIRRAVLAARRTATPKAALMARREAGTAARSAGLTLGSVVSVSESEPAFYFGPSFYDAALGSFGPGRFCGFVRRPVFKRDPQTGARRVVRRVRRWSCRVPRTYIVSLEIAYEAG
ncbi:MAG: hypothetical protein R2725_14755 [Solirubrobacterales bacterium]